MPNIEIHGLSLQEWNELRKKIFKLFEDKPYVDEMVVTVFQDAVFDKRGSSRPFIRLVNSSQEFSDEMRAEEILEALKTLNIDIEHLELKVFIPFIPGKHG